MYAWVQAGVDWLAAGGGAVLLACLVLGTLTPVSQAILLDSRFDPWIGGLIPLSAVASQWVLTQRFAHSLSSATWFTLLIPMAIAGAYMTVLISSKRWIENSALVGLILLLILLAFSFVSPDATDVIGKLTGVVQTTVDQRLTVSLGWLAAAVACAALVIAPAFDIMVAGRQRALLLGLPWGYVQAAGIVIVAMLTSVIVTLGYALPLVGLVACRLVRYLPVSDHRHVLVYSALVSAVLGSAASLLVGWLPLAVEIDR